MQGPLQRHSCDAAAPLSSLKVRPSRKAASWEALRPCAAAVRYLPMRLKQSVNSDALSASGPVECVEDGGSYWREHEALLPMTRECC
eukprot:5362842-Prorocentrum_lima.AAC.1